MRAPCFANAKAQAAPIPRDAPVISTPRGGALDAENDSEIAVSLIWSLSIPDKTGCRSLLTCLPPLDHLRCLVFCVIYLLAERLFSSHAKEVLPDTAVDPNDNAFCSFYNILDGTSSCTHLPWKAVSPLLFSANVNHVRLFFETMSKLEIRTGKSSFLYKYGCKWNKNII